MKDKCIACNLCVKNCPMLHEVKVNPQEVLKGGELGVKAVFSCSNCGVCREVCPKDIYLGEEILRRKSSLKKDKETEKKLKQVANFQKWTAGSLFTSEVKEAEVLILPGCSLASIDGGIIQSIKSYLEKVMGKTEVYIDCCGKPSKVVGDTELFDKTYNKYISSIKKSGAKHIVTTCGNCYNILKKEENLDVILIWSILKEKGLPEVEDFKKIDKIEFVLHDPCSFRGNQEVHNDIREIIDKLGLKYTEYKNNRNKSRCCGAGGMMYFLNKDMFIQTGKNRIEEGGGREILCYCQSCVESFTSGGGLAYNILDFIFTSNHMQGLKKQKFNSFKRWSNRFINKRL